METFLVSEQFLSCEFNPNPGRTTIVFLFQYLYESFKITRSIDADALLGKACVALAQSYYEQGELAKCLEYLRLYTDTYHAHDDRHEYIKASTCLGTIYNLTVSNVTSH